MFPQPLHQVFDSLSRIAWKIPATPSSFARQAKRLQDGGSDLRVPRRQPNRWVRTIQHQRAQPLGMACSENLAEVTAVRIAIEIDPLPLKAQRVQHSGQIIRPLYAAIQ